MENKDIKALNEEQLEKISGGAVAELPEDERILPFEPGEEFTDPEKRCRRPDILGSGR